PGRGDALVQINAQRNPMEASRQGRRAGLAELPARVPTVGLSGRRQSRMSGPVVSVRLDGRRRHYQPGEALTGEFVIETLKPDEIKAVELSVIWHTEGKGDEDVGLHYFKRYSGEEQFFDPRATMRFATEDKLPSSPLSYDGRILKIR